MEGVEIHPLHTSNHVASVLILDGPEALRRVSARLDPRFSGRCTRRARSEEIAIVVPMPDRGSPRVALPRSMCIPVRVWGEEQR